MRGCCMECMAGGTGRGAGLVSGRFAGTRSERIQSFPSGSSGCRSQRNEFEPGELSDANLEGANLFKAVLDGADLADAFLHGAQFVNCAQLVLTRNWQSAFRDEALACGEAIPGDIR